MDELHLCWSSLGQEEPVGFVESFTPVSVEVGAAKTRLPQAMESLATEPTF